MAEIEIGGIKFRGGKVLVIITALSSAIGVLWGGFEAYSRYLDMEQKIDNYIAPDLTGINEKLNLVTKDNQNVKDRIMEMQGIVRDIREDTRSDAASLHNAIGGVDKRSRRMDTEVRESMRSSEKLIRDIISDASNRFDRKINTVDDKIDALEKRMDKKVQDALDNPLLKGK